MGEHLGVRELRANAAAIVRRAEGGERIIITVHGRPVAEIGPVGGAAQQPTLSDLVARGLLRAPTSADRSPSSSVTELWAGVRLDRLLSEVRGR